MKWKINTIFAGQNTHYSIVLKKKKNDCRLGDKFPCEILYKKKNLKNPIVLGCFWGI